MIFLLYFLGGILFIIFFQPIIEKITYFISTYFEYLSYKIAQAIYVIQKAIGQTQETEDGVTSPKNPMGFHIQRNEYEYQQDQNFEEGEGGI